MTTPDQLPRHYGQIAYEAYLKRTGGKSLVTGAALPNWSEQNDDLQDAWNVAAQAVLDYTKRIPR